MAAQLEERLVHKLEERIQTTVLDDGVIVVTEQMNNVRSVTMGVWVDVGSRDETPVQAGASHFLEHLAFKGTLELSARDIAERVDAMGGDMNAFTTKEYTAYHLRSLDEDANEGLSLLCDIVSRPAFREEEVASEQRVILEEIAMRADEPDELCHELLHNARFPDHTLGRDVAGSVETVSAMSPALIKDFHRSTYGPNSVVVAAAGSLDHDQVVKLVKGRLELPGESGRVDRIGPSARPQSVVGAHDDTEQVHVAIALSGYARAHSDRHAWGVVDHVLGGGLSSRLFQEIREARGLAYSVYSYRAPYEDAGFTGISFGTAPEHLTEVLDLVQQELEKLRSGGVSDAELSRCKRSLRGGAAMAMEDTGSRMSRLGRGQLLMGEVVSLDDVLARTEAVTRQDCARVIEHVLTGPRSISVVGPVEFAGHSLIC
jgi:predicted Zn-dependent peptidase